MIGLEWKVLVLLIMFVSNISSSILTVTRDNHTIPGEKGALTILVGQPQRQQNLTNPNFYRT